jgi:predicted metal-dependent hydrolase
MKDAPKRSWTPLEIAIPRDVFKTEVESWAQRLKVRPNVIHVRSMSRKWGSCSTSGRLTFASDLLQQHAAFRRRVIVEELLHLRIPNHGKLFKSLLRAHLNSEV